MDISNNTSSNQLLPGQHLRIGVDLIADKKAGALIVIAVSYTHLTLPTTPYV